MRGSAASPARVSTRGQYVSVQVNVDAQGNNVVGDAANEPSIAVDPTNPTRMAIGWRQFDRTDSNFRQSGMAYSQDAGQTWTFPGVLEPGEFSSDPVLEADADGRFYCYALQPDRGPGEWGCYMYRSDDGGLTWPQEVYAWGGDKAWITIDRTEGIGRGNIYSVWSVNAACCGPEIFTRSTDGGLTFSRPIEIENSPRFGTLTVGPDGTVYVAGGTSTSSGVFYVARSTNAQDRSATPVFDRVTTVYLGGGTAFSTGPNPAGLLGQVWIASDHSEGPTRGNLYMLSSVNPPGSDPLDVMFIRSTDGGVTWSAPLRVNDDPTNLAWQWFGTMAVAPNGRIDVIWNDTRGDLSATFSELYYSYSLDTGVTWSENVPLSQPFNHFLGYPQQNKLGDYYDMVSDNFGADVAYAATFNDEQDVYYLRIGDLDCNGNGIDDIDDIADGTSDDCNHNDIPDECDTDCNANDLVDHCEILDGAAGDCDDNSVPDECEADYDEDGFIDACDADIDNDGFLNDVDVCDFTPPGLPLTDRGTLLGDHDRNCVVDLADLQRLIYCASRSGPGYLIGPTCTDGYDYDGDHDIDLRDCHNFLAAFGRQ